MSDELQNRHDARDRPGALRVGIALPAGTPGWGADGEAAAHLVRAEGDGVAFVWIDARPPAREHDAIQCAAAAIALTRRVEIAVDGLAWPPASWLRVAEDLASLDALSGGRIHAVIRLAPDAPLGAVLEDLELVRRAWSGGAVEHESSRRRASGVEVHPKPARSGGPELWVSADTGVAPRAFEIARRADLGLLLESPEVFEAFLEFVGSRGGRPQGDPARSVGPRAVALRAPPGALGRAEDFLRRLGDLGGPFHWIESVPDRSL